MNLFDYFSHGEWLHESYKVAIKYFMSLRNHSHAEITAKLLSETVATKSRKVSSCIC